MRRKLIIISLLLITVIILYFCSDQLSTQQQKFVGSINSDKYHYPSCEWAKKIKPENQIWFSSPEEAKEAGYKPCKVCRPPN